MTTSRAIPILKPGIGSGPGQSPRITEIKLPSSPLAGNADLPGVIQSVASSSTPSSSTLSAIVPTKRLCKNIFIYGHCKFEGKGCVDNHDIEGKELAIPTLSRAPTPSSSASGISHSGNAAQLAGLTASANIFIPKAITSSNPITSSIPSTSQSQDFPQDPEEFGQGSEFFDELNPYASAHSSQTNPQHHYEESYFEPTYGQQHQQQEDYDYAYQQDPLMQQMQNPYYAQPNGAHGGYGMSRNAAQPLQYHLYQPSLPHVSTPNHPQQLIAQSFFMSPTLREDLQRRMEATAHLPTHKIQGDGDLGQYWGLIPLDKRVPDQIRPGIFGYRSWAYKATNEMNGKSYALRRIEGLRMTNEAAITLVDTWARVRCPNIVSVREAFTTRAFNDHSLIFVYDYHPLSSTLLDIHLSPPARGTPPLPLIPERVLWSYLVQLATATKTVHNVGLAVRCLDPSKILLTGQNRLRINCCAVLDVIAYDAGNNIPGYQQEDLLSLGKLMISLATHSLEAIRNLQASLEVASRSYSQDFQNALLYLFSKPNHPRKNIDEFCRLISERIIDELDGGLDQADLLEAELSRELENGRLFRLMAKFGFINERPEYDHDPRWAETGDRYIIKLFRDFVFHQMDEMGRPVIDLSHVLTCLNKLDAGVDEQLALVSRDEQSCLIVSFREVKSCLESSFRELAR